MLMNRKVVAVIVSLLFVVLLLPLHLSQAATGDNLANEDVLKIHGTDGIPPLQSSITIKDGTTEIFPNLSNEYENIPAGATVELKYAFSLFDDKFDNQTGPWYVYKEGDYFEIPLPNGVVLDDGSGNTSGIVGAVDATYGSYNLGNWKIDSGKLIVTLTTDGADEKYRGKWAYLDLTGTFQPLVSNDGKDTKIVFGEDTFEIIREPLPTESTLEKTGAYDVTANEITWAVTIKPPAAEPDISYKGYTVKDVYSDNQVYVEGSFKVKDGAKAAVPVPDVSTDLDLTKTNTVEYTFPDETSGTQIITYKTKPNDFSGGQGGAVFSNKASLWRGADEAAEPVEAEIALNWITKSGEAVEDDSGPGVIKWTITVKVPGEEGKVLPEAKIIDKLHKDLKLFVDDDHKVEIDGSEVVEGANPGEYSYNTDDEGDTLTYSFPGGKPEAGEEAVLTFYTKVKDEERDKSLNNNEEIKFGNTAKLVWKDNTDLAKVPSYTINDGGVGIGGGGLLSKSAPNSPYKYGDVITWTITVNKNKVNMTGVEIVDVVPTRQELLIDNDSHKFSVVNRDNSSESFDIESKATDSTKGFTYDGTNEKFSLSLGNIGTDTYTITYSTQITDLGPLYTNGDVEFKNEVKLMRTSEDPVSVTGTKTFSSQMLEKSIPTAYNYNTHLIQWQIVVNKNMLPLTNAVVTDTLPDGMVLYIDDDKTFKVEKKDKLDNTTVEFEATKAETKDSFTYVDEKNFRYTISETTSTSDQYTITFWSKLTDEKLKEQWSGDKSFTNKAELNADEISGPIESTATAKIKNPVLTKTGEQGDDGAKGSSDTIYWSVALNLAQVPLVNAEVEDTLNVNLQLDEDSVKLYQAKVKSDGTIDKDELTKVDSITMDYAQGTNTLTVKLPDAPHAYLLEFSTILLDSSIGNLENTVKFSGESIPDNTGGSGSVVIADVYSSGGSGSNKLTVIKKDKDSIMHLKLAPYN